MLLRLARQVGFALTSEANFAPTTLLGRWCLPTAPAYAATCNQVLKAQLATDDNGIGATKTDSPKEQQGTSSLARRDHSVC